MSLNDIIGRVIEIAEDANGTIDKNLAARAGVPLVMEDDEAIDECVRETVWRRVNSKGARMERSHFASAGRQNELFPGLRARYAVDLEGRVLKRTERLTQLEFERVISIREKQVADDTAQLTSLKMARDELSGIWKLYPDLTFGEVEALFRRSQAA
jgi:hypothetical protein